VLIFASEAAGIIEAVVQLDDKDMLSRPLVKDWLLLLLRTSAIFCTVTFAFYFNFTSV
jgi:hypothetical protein